MMTLFRFDWKNFKNMRRTPLAMAAVAILGLGAAAGTWATLGRAPLAAAGGAVVAKVNGQAVSRAAFERVWTETQQNSRALDMQENRQLVLDSIVGAELLAQQARNDGQLMQDAQLQAAMEMQQRNLLANAYVAEFLRRNPVGDAALKSAHEQFVKDLGTQEHHLRHVLLSKQEDAESLHAKLSRGETTMAKAVEATEEKANDGKRATGDLGFIAEGRLAPQLKDAVGLLKGQPGYVKPYADQFGWHVVYIEESRPVKVPSFDQVRGELIPMAQRIQLRDHLVALKEKASIRF